MENDKKLEAMIKRFKTAYNLRKLKDMIGAHGSSEKPIDELVRKVERYLQDSILECEKLGVTNDMFKGFSVEYSLMHECSEIEYDYRDKCLFRMRHDQCYQSLGEDIPECPLNEQHSCSPFCKKFQAASDVQYKRFIYEEDVDTGEKLSQR